MTALQSVHYAQNGVNIMTEGTTMESLESFGGWIHQQEEQAQPKWRDVSISANSCKFQKEIGLGLRFRSLTPGPEQDLVDAFLSTLSARTPHGQKLTVFCQPKLDSGYPDLVGVVWRTATARSWPSEREQLVSADLQLLHALVNSGWTEIDFLEGVFRRKLKRSLDRLEGLDLIFRTKKKCKIRALKQIFAVERIIAIEAKVSSWQRALEQACVNAWFSSESHALFPNVSNSEAISDSAKRFQIGVLEFDQVVLSEFCVAPQREVPLSYGSWLFNEWVWRIDRQINHI